MLSEHITVHDDMNPSIVHTIERLDNYSVSQDSAKARILEDYRTYNNIPVDVDNPTGDSQDAVVIVREDVATVVVQCHDGSLTATVTGTEPVTVVLTEMTDDVMSLYTDIINNVSSALEDLQF